MKIFEKWLDNKLYCQMINMIYRHSTHEDAKSIYNQICGRSVFWCGDVYDRIEDIYELRYPGEVLERLAQQTVVTKRQVYALGLALVETKELHDDNMFVKDQKTTFYRSLFSNWRNDRILLGIYCIWGERDQKEAYELFDDHPMDNLEDIFFALHVYPDNEQIWNKVKGNLNQLLGKQRKISVFDQDVYLWITNNLYTRVKGYRKKDIDVIKYLIRLAQNYAKENHVIRRRLLQEGYSIVEILYLNHMLQYARIPNVLNFKSSTSERMAVELCTLILNAEEEYPKTIYELCNTVIYRYLEYYIKIDGDSGIFDSIALVRPRNIESYMCLYPYRNQSSACPEWYLINLNDPKWHPLRSRMGDEDFDEAVINTLNHMSFEDEDNVKRYLQNYELVTNNDLKLMFWEKENFSTNKLFRKLMATTHQSYLLKLILQYCVEVRMDESYANELWQYMLLHIKDYLIGVTSKHVFQAYCTFINNGRESDISEVLLQSFRLKPVNSNRTTATITRDFLSESEQITLLCWVEEAAFRHSVNKYWSFLLHVLTNEQNLTWLPVSDLYEICEDMIALTDKNYTVNQLRQIYMAEEEYNRYQEQLIERKRRKEWLEKRNEELEWKRELTVVIATGKKSGELFKCIHDHIDYCHYSSRKPKKRFVLSFILDMFQTRDFIALSKKEISFLSEMLVNYYAENKIDFATLKSIVGCCVEEEKYDSISDDAGDAA